MQISAAFLTGILRNGILALGFAGALHASPLNPLNYSVSHNSNVGYFGYDDNSYHATGLGDPVPGALSGGVGDLTDGVIGGSVAYGYWYWSPYVLWDGQSPTLTFDFGSQQSFDLITFHGMSYNQAAVYSLPSAHFAVSNDGTNFTAIQSESFAEVLGSDVNYDFAVSGNPGLSGRYLQILLDSPGRWIALSEITFDGTAGAGNGGGGNAVPDSGATLAFTLPALAMLGLMRRRQVAC